MEMEKETEKNPSNEKTARQAVLIGGPNDGTLAVSFSYNDLEAYADFIPARLNGEPLSVEVIKQILDRIHVVHGILWDDIKKAMDECNSSRRQIRDVLIAKGSAPEHEISEYYDLNPVLRKIKRQFDQKARIDHREHSPFIIVKKGQTLAVLRPLRPGKEGATVHGIAVPFETRHPEGVTGGENTSTADSKIISNIHGQFIENKKLLSVQENLAIKGSVGYGTGNIIFPGNVTIEGLVSDGFKIISGGSILIKQTLDLTEVVAKGDIAVNGGIIGKGPALIKAGGGIRTKFIEGCNAAARKSVLVDSGIINSSVFALGTVEVSEKGKILGGDIYATHGLRAGAVGKKGGSTTKIHCGIDFSAQQVIENCNNQLRILAAKQERLKAMMEDPDNDEEKRGKMEELSRRLETEQKSISSRITQLMGNINVDEDAKVEVSGEIAPGTLVEICQIALYVEEPLKNVRIRLDKTCGKLITESL
ncbi:MAG: FapA family protein [Treponema sp.]|nr:FapA family protein [Treponema sp.]